MRDAIWQSRAELLRPFDGGGFPVAEVASRLGLTAVTVRTYARRFGFKIGTIDGQSIPHRNKMMDRVEALRDCRARGLTRLEAASELGLTPATVHRYCHDFSIEFPHGRSCDPKTITKAEAMAAMYSGGKTLAEIGELFGVSRERVRQIMTKHHGMRRDGGGQHVRAQRKKVAKARNKDTAALRKHGCSHAEYRALVELGRTMKADGISHDRTPTGAWHSQRANANSRGIEWNLLLWDWWNIWQQSGKWNDRGRTKGSYVMCRFGDTGAYEVGNVYIATCSHNCSVQPNHPRHQPTAEQVAA